MSFKNKTSQQFISLIILISMLIPTVLLSKPKQAEALAYATVKTDFNTGVTAKATTKGAISEGTSTLQILKNAAKEVLKQIGISLARKALRDITKSTVNFINTGHWGNPLFLENPESFFTDVVKYEVKSIVDTFGYDLKRFPFGKNFALNTIYTYKRKLEANTEYSLSKVMQDPILLRRYRSEFSVGGWDGFLMHTQYPQNNPIGFNMLATEELARKLEGTAESAAQEVKKKLDQGMGFLSPQNCPSNTNYNTVGNQFQKPTFKPPAPSSALGPPPESGDYYDDSNTFTDSGELIDYDTFYATDPGYLKYKADLAAWEAKYDAEVGVAEGKWRDENYCPGGLKDTTPGAVIANATMEALKAPQQNVYASMVTGSLSVIFDALLNKFLGEGLNALATTVNPGPQDDKWDYMGNTLGTVTAYNTTSWDWSADEIILLSEFKKEVEDGIRNTTRELGFIYNESLTNPGIIQVFSSTWPKIRDLDMCIPGPNLNWEDRVDEEMARNSNKLMEKSSDNDGEKAAAAQFALGELRLAVNFLKDWIKTQQLSALPSNILYLDALDELEEIHQQANRLTDKKMSLTRALARLESIKTVLDTITVDPETGTDQADILIELKKQYNATRDTISNTTSVDDTRNELSTARDTYTRMIGLLDKCNAERTAKGWSGNNGANAILSPSNVTELALFCSNPIKGGYTHEPFNGPDTTRPRLPMVNARNVYSNSSFFGLRTSRVNIEMQCPIIFRAADIEYKGNLMGPVGDLDLIDLEDFQDGDQCADTGNKYTSDLRKAMDAVLAANPDVANLPNIEDSNGYKANGYRFMQLVEAELKSNGLNATADVLNGNNNRSKGDIIAIWKDRDEFMERYDTLLGDNDKTIAEAAITDFKGFIPKDCTATGGSTDCGCRTNTDGTDDTETPPVDPAPVCNTCAEKQQADKYQADVKSAVKQALTELEVTSPGIGNLSRNNDSAVSQLRDKTIAILRTREFTATTSGNPPYPQVINVSKAGDPDYHGYRIVAGQDIIVKAIDVGYCGGHETFAGVDIIPNFCQAPPPNPSPGSGNAFISSVTPTTAKPGTTTITISGTDLTNQVSFFDGGGERSTVVGSVNSTKTQTTVLVPDALPIGNATVKIYQGNQIWSNGKLIAISASGGTGGTGGTGGGSVATVTSYNATSGWGGNLAFNSTNNTWLVVSAGGTGKGTYGKIMNNNGTPASSQITITAGDSGGPKVAYSKDVNKYLVVWLEWDDGNNTSSSQIKARFINPDGTFSGNPFLVHNDATWPNDSSMAYSNSAMQYDSKNKKFVYVWQTGNPGLHSNLRTISTTGVVGNRINLTSGLSAPYAEDGRGDPAVAIKESTNEYCVVYGRGYALNNVWNASLKARTVNALTGAIGPETTIVSASGPNAIFNTRGIVYNSVNNKYLVNWTSASSGAQGKFMTSCDGSTAGATLTLNSFSSAHSLAYNPTSNQYASIGQNGPNAGNTYVILNSNGVKVSEGVAFAGGYGNFSPTIAANTTNGTFAATSALEYGTTRFAPNLGTAVGGSTSSGTVTNPKKIDLGVGTFPDPVFYNGRIYVAVQQGSKLTLYNWDKNLTGQQSQQITFSGVGQAFPRLTVSNGVLWLAFRNGDNSSGSVKESIKLWKSDTGAISDLGFVTNSGNDPVAVGNGYIAWQNKVSGTIKVFRRALTGGTVTEVRNGLPTGISRILADGSIIMIDTDRNAVAWGVNAWFAGALTVAADVTPNDDNGVVGRFNNASSTEFNIWPNQMTKTPHAATDGAGNYVIATWNPTIRLAAFNKP
jgi:hypothetical protein